MAVTCNNCGYCDMVKKGLSCDIEIYFCPNCGNLQGERIMSRCDVDDTQKEPLKKGA